MEYTTKGDFAFLKRELDLVMRAESRAKIGIIRLNEIISIAQIFPYYVVVGAGERCSIEAVAVMADGEFLAMRVVTGPEESFQTATGQMMLTDGGMFSNTLATVQEQFLDENNRMAA